MRRFSRYVLVVPLVTMMLVANVRAASTFADQSFQQQWQQGEAITPNFWGPLTNAKDGQQEPYKEAQGGTRLVQYFDKGRMELTNGTVTNGLLAKELVTGRVQQGDTSFDDHQPPAISIAGDPDSGPTYVAFGTFAKEVLAPGASRVGQDVRYFVTKTTFSILAAPGEFVNGQGTPQPGNAPGQYPITGYDTATQHNIYTFFAQYRDRVGLATIGLAISEPFLSRINVAGQQRMVVVQAFERRVLTYTADNPDAFKVEMGNVGQHYYQWRYASPQDASQPAVTSIAATPTQAGITLTGTSSRDIPASDIKGATQGVHVEDLRIDPGEQSHTVTLTNTTGGTLTFTVQIPAPLTVTPTSGNIPPGQAISLTVGRGSAASGTVYPMFIDVGANRITITVTA